MDGGGWVYSLDGGGWVTDWMVIAPNSKSLGSCPGKRIPRFGHVELFMKRETITDVETIVTRVEARDCNITPGRAPRNSRDNLFISGSEGATAQLGGSSTWSISGAWNLQMSFVTVWLTPRAELLSSPWGGSGRSRLPPPKVAAG
ncbi:hypothetical protein Btru_069199 [Bulinus truncatus]|nr:hypothetical protein Btru_069199 [Bulinus truncatus]